MAKTPRRMNAILTVVAVTTVVIGAAVMALFPTAGRLVNVGKDFEFPAKLLEAHIYTITRHGDNVTLISDGTLGRKMEPEGRFWESTFTLNARDEFYSLPGQRGDTQFRLDRIVDDGVDISYVTRQRPSARGEAAVPIDHGVLHLTWRSGRSPYAMPPSMAHQQAAQ